MADTFVEYTGDGTQTDFSIPFNYLSEDYVKVAVDGTDVSFTFFDAFTVRCDSAPANGTNVKVYRDTERTDLILEIPSAGSFSGDDLNDQAQQALDIAAEAYDALTGVMSNEGASGQWDADSLKIENLDTPTAASDAATKQYVDNQYATIETAIEGYRDDAETARDAAQTAQSNAETAETNAETAESGAEDAQGYAEEWANRAEDSLVSAAAGGDQSDDYSAKHWSKKSEGHADDAESWAASVNLPSISGNGDSYLRAKNDETGHEYRTPAQARADLSALKTDGSDVDNPDFLNNVLPIGNEGDIIYRGSSGWQKLAKGTEGQKIRQNSALTAPEWESGWETIFEGSLPSAAEHDFTDLGVYEVLEIDAYFLPSVDGNFVGLRFSANNGSSFDATNNYTEQFIYANSGAPTTVSASGGTESRFAASIAGVDDVLGAYCRGRLMGFNKSERTHCISYLAGRGSSGTNDLYMGQLGGFHGNASAQNAISFFVSNGTLSGRLLLRGKRG